MKKRLVAVFMLVLIIFTGCFKKEQISREDLDKYSKLAQTAISSAMEGDYDSFMDMSDDIMKAAIDKDKFDEVTKLVKEKGDFVEFTQSDGVYIKNQNTNENNVTIIQQVKLSEGENTYTISFNKDGKMSGFFVK